MRTHASVSSDTHQTFNCGWRVVNTLVLVAVVSGLSACKSTDRVTSERDPMPEASSPTADSRDAPDRVWSDNPLRMRDATLRFDASAWDAGEHDRTAVDEQGRLVVASPDTAYPASGRWTSPVFEADWPVTELLPSMNLDAPADTGVRMLWRLRVDGEWSPWLDLDGWGDLTGTGRGSTTDFAHGTVEIDWVELNEPADALQARLELVSFDAASPDARRTPAVSHLVGVYSGSLPADVVLAADSANDNERGDALDDQTGTDLAVPMFRQGRNGPALAPRTCSPTSVTMAMAFHGVTLDPRAVSEAIYDRRYNIFGNWARAVAFASTHGLHAELQRFRTWDDLRDTLASGAPVIASIRFEEGEFPSNKMKRTSGHLILIRGLTDAGDAIVNDPAYDEGGEGVVYKKEELARAWLAKGGVGYVIRKP